MKTLPLGFGPTLFVLVLAACGDSTTAQNDASGFDAAPPDADATFPVAYDTTSIVLAQERTRTVAGVDYSERHYLNNAYRCCRTVTFTFLVFDRADLAGQPAPLWAILHGGGVGYYDAQQIYHGPVQANDENTMDQLEGVLAGHLLDGARIKLYDVRVAEVICTY